MTFVVTLLGVDLGVGGFVFVLTAGGWPWRRR